jgi:hypothetical protein
MNVTSATAGLTALAMTTAVSTPAGAQANVSMVAKTLNTQEAMFSELLSSLDSAGASIGAFQARLNVQ